MNGYRVRSAGVVAGDVVRAGLDLLVRDGRVLDLVRAGTGPEDWPTLEAPGVVAPAFVDLHSHGYGGVNFADADADQLGRAREGLFGEGVGGFLASLATMAPERLVRQLERLAPLVGRVEAGRATILGVHLEGPYLSRAKRGAQPAALLRRPDAAEMAGWLAHARGTVRQVTLAPELEGYAPAARSVEAAGARVALGHSDATMTDALDAIARGARHVTHLWNGMSGVSHRDAGLVAAAFLARETTVEVIADGIHIDPPMVELTYRLVGDQRLCLVTDAIAATAVGDGVYEGAGHRVTVTNGIARTEDGALAGSTLTLARAVANIVRWGVAPLAGAVEMATRTPARALGLEPWGTLVPGAPACLVALDGEGRLLAWPERVRLQTTVATEARA